ncbi:MAG: hypothetical protein J6U04_08925 [Salinivirgaceae bacterium]|nr:hypothetical protein [Salinivirgaceae bacterium]
MDRRLENICAFCGSFAETEDHVPSRCFLDKPYPQNMPVVPCCRKCNHGFSKDEEYISCFIDCMKANTADPNKIQREKTRKTLMHSPKLQERIASQIRDFGGVTIYDYEKDRLNRVVRKLAYGHLSYENDTLSWDSTYHISMWLLPALSESQKCSFFEPYEGELLPEVGSRSLLNNVVLIQGNNEECTFLSNWITVQENRYSYCVSPESNRVKFIIADYLAVEVHIIE